MAMDSDPAEDALDDDELDVVTGGGSAGLVYLGPDNPTSEELTPPLTQQPFPRLTSRNTQI